jgi:hypothetical protein
MQKMSVNKIGLAVGGTFAVFHIAWSLLVLAGVAKVFMDWVLGLHFMEMEYSVTPFVLLNAVMLAIVTGVIGYLLGCVFGWLWNFVHKMSHEK